MTERFIVIAGPCVIESKELIDETASVLNNFNNLPNVDFYFKSSYKKANRTSQSSFTGLGDVSALEILAETAEKYGLKTLTDIHSVEEAFIAAKYVDVLQIPAFLCRQTELLLAAAETGKIVNIKKGQFLNPSAMLKAADKVASAGNNNIWLTERGTFFGYSDLVVDFRSFDIMSKSGYPVIFDATHSVQQPAIGEQSGGNREFIFSLAKAAAAVCIDGIFFETHPNPSKALSDSATQLPLENAEYFLNMLIDIRNNALKWKE